MIKEVIIVEGKTDTQKLKKIFGEEIKTIETHGLALNDKTLSLIKKINENQGIIIFTDPDGPGKKIREKINNYVGGKTKNAFVEKSAINKNNKKIGIAEANPEDIKNALDNLITFNSNNLETITWNQYLENDFYLKANRIKICNHFGWDEKISSKTLFKWINLTQLTIKQIQNILGD
ncbi:ribonuclease M5 [Williamsoniiplasma somnilux]|uniref:Ribonuclease M5 n=1 Tax=Williamsoniiplasma somnilux TaxID=215578 RepID=A0A2K8P064_9MOLU|nr:ribonuclease M5 [Williamsoniiplasma somnilux]ATZ18391.1 ribonuclease M5 [Williamsoniiplasma somnilux]